MRSFRPLEYPLDSCVTGPHQATAADGEPALVFRCELCGTESSDASLRRGCWNCDSEVGWR